MLQNLVVRAFASYLETVYRQTTAAKQRGRQTNAGLGARMGASDWFHPTSAKPEIVSGYFSHIGRTTRAMKSRFAER